MVGLQPALTPYLERYHALQITQDTSTKLIEDLLCHANDTENALREENATLGKRLQDAQLDLEDATRSRRELQQQLNIANQRLSQYGMDNDNLKNRNPYVMVLIDGDGTIFLEEYIRQGIEGGKKAANALRAAVLEQCQFDDVEVIAKVCANLDGLTNAMVREGTLNSHDELRNFALGFTQGKASFDFIDVGHGKERADSKIKEAARWNLRNHNCKKILLGVSHDAGYAPFLDEILRDDHVTRRVAIIEGSAIVPGLRTTGAGVINFDHIFRNDNVSPRRASGINGQQANIPLRSVTNGNRNGTMSPMPPTPSTWAGVTSVVTTLQTPPPLVFPVTIKPTAEKKENKAGEATITTPQPKMKWNPGPRGLDESITINAAVLNKVRQRVGNAKLCNNHYLRGPCSKQDECPFEHKYKASEEDIKAIAFLTRLNPCVNGQNCEAEYCPYGHVCPSWGIDLTKAGGNRGEEGVCGAFGCRFDESGHPPGTKIKHPKKKTVRPYSGYD